MGWEKYGTKRQNLLLKKTIKTYHIFSAVLPILAELAVTEIFHVT